MTFCGNESNSFNRAFFEEVLEDFYGLLGDFSGLPPCHWYWLP